MARIRDNLFSSSNFNTTHVVKVFVCVLCVMSVVSFVSAQLLFPAMTKVHTIDSIASGMQPLSEQTHRKLSQSNNQSQIPKILWIYADSFTLKTQSTSSQFILRQLNQLNARQFAIEQNYTIFELTKENYHEYLEKEMVDKIQNVIMSLDQRLDKEEGGKVLVEELRGSKQNITKRLIIYAILSQHGGIFIDSRATLIQPLNSLLTTLQSTLDLNIGIRQTLSPQCFAFYNEEYSSMKTRVHQLQRQFELEKDVVMYPNVEDYFMVCEKGSKFLQRLMDVYADVLVEGRNSAWMKKLNTDENLIGRTEIKKIYLHGHILASHVTLQQQQYHLSLQKSPTSILAIDSLAIRTINCRLSPTKLQTQFKNNEYKSISYLTKLNMEEIELIIGKFQYAFYLSDNVVEMMIGELMRGETVREFVVEGSFVDMFWFDRLVKGRRTDAGDDGLEEFVRTVQDYKVIKAKRAINQSNVAKTLKPLSILTPQPSSTSLSKLRLNSTQPQWSSLPRNIWIIWDNGIDRSNFFVEMCYQNLKLSAENSNFTLTLITKQNIKQFISAELLNQINHAIQHAAYELSNQAISDMWRLALVYEQGGVYLDASTFQTDFSFEWITKLPQLPRQLIWNRYGQTPQVFMLWNSYYGSPLDWKVDTLHQTRDQWHLSYENNFIVAVKNNKLIKEWLQAMMEWITLDFDIVYEEMRSVDMTGHSWTSKKLNAAPQRYLTAMDAIKYVVGRRKKLLEQQQGNNITATEFYKLWSMPGQMLGQQKFRGETNYQNKDYRLDDQQPSLNNNYRYKYPLSYVQSVMGPPMFQVKFFGYEVLMLNKILINFYRDNKQGFDLKKLEDIVHPKSLVAVKLFQPAPSKTIECLKKYAELCEFKIKLKAISKIWRY